MHHQGVEGHLSRLVVRDSINKNVVYDQFCEVLPTAALILCSNTYFTFRTGNDLYIQSYCGNYVLEFARLFFQVVSSPPRLTTLFPVFPTIPKDSQDFVIK